MSSDTPCTHDFVEREEAATVDGLCPLCLQRQNAAMQKLIYAQDDEIGDLELTVAGLRDAARPTDTSEPVPAGTPAQKLIEHLTRRIQNYERDLAAARRDAQDARRYRYIRRYSWDLCSPFMPKDNDGEPIITEHPEELDAAIDAALAADDAQRSKEGRE
jgi:hypothetical protein